MNTQTTLIARKTKKMPKYTFITEQEYTNIKMLQTAGLTVSQTSKVTKRAPITISKLFKSGSLDEYKSLSSYKKPKETPPEQEPNDLTANEEILQLLSVINDRLSNIEKSLTSRQDNKQWFPIRKSE